MKTVRPTIKSTDKPIITVGQAALRNQTKYVKTLQRLAMFHFVFWCRGERISEDSPTNYLYDVKYRMVWNVWHPFVIPYLVLAVFVIPVIGTLIFGFRELPQIMKETWQHVGCAERRL